MNPNSAAETSAATRGEQQHASVDRDRHFAAEGQRAEPWRQNEIRRSRRDPRERQPADAAGGGEHQRFREQLPREPADAGAEREPQREFAPARQRAPQLQVRDVDAADDQDERDRAHQRRSASSAACRGPGRPSS